MHRRIVAFSAFLASFRAFFSLFRSSKKGIRRSISPSGSGKCSNKCSHTFSNFMYPGSRPLQYTFCKGVSHGDFTPGKAHIFPTAQHIRPFSPWQNAKGLPLVTRYFDGRGFPCTEDGVFVGFFLLVGIIIQMSPQCLVMAKIAGCRVEALGPLPLPIQISNQSVFRGWKMS